MQSLAISRGWVDQTVARWCSLAFGVALTTGCVEQVLDASAGSQPLKPGQQCQPESVLRCDDGLVCEPLASDPSIHICTSPTLIEGYVVDSIDATPIAGAHVIATDPLGIPTTTTATTDRQGRYHLIVSVARDSTGALAESPQWTLIVTARDYLPFPGQGRPALPISAIDAVEQESRADHPIPARIIENASTTVALIPRPPDAGIAVTVSGIIDAEQSSGTLVVAEGPNPAPSAVADHQGHFTLFNVPAGPITVRGYRQGLDLNSLSVTVDREDLTDLRLTAQTESSGPMASIRGSVAIVNAPGTAATSVVAIPSSVFDPTLIRSPVPLGLRAPSPPEEPNISSAFEILDVPWGRYTIVAAFENDGLVLDPDTSIGGTQYVEVNIVDHEPIGLDQNFKVTEAIEIIAPGADAPETTDGSPMFIWIDDSSEDRYEIEVRDALGQRIWHNDQIDKVTATATVELPYGGPPLIPGMYYQFRVTSWRDRPQGATALSRTEDLRGVFIPQSSKSRKNIESTLNDHQQKAQN